MPGETVDVLVRARMEASSVEAGVGQIQKALKGLTLPKGISDDLEKSFSKLNPLLKDYQKQLNKGFSNKKDLQNFNTLKEKINEVFGEISSKIQQVNSKEIKLKTDVQAIEKAEREVTKLSNDLQKALDGVITKNVNTSNIDTQFNKILNSFTRATSLKPMTQTAKNLFNAKDFAGYNAELDKIQNKIKSLSAGSKFNFAKSLGFKGAVTDIDGINQKITGFFNNIRANAGKVQSIETLRQKLREASQEASQLKLDAVARGAQGIANAASGVQNLGSSLRNAGDGAQQAASGLLSAKEQVEQLKYSTQYFFSLRNMFSLLRRGIDDAIESVRDLDKAMTETAVVTDFSVSDMWNMLPEYTALANKLGATTQGAYETMTLYFQQGLDKQQTFEIGEETMKMARIAGLDYADTTNMMTAALRGFNMELNKTSAERVNDVYSKLAAITASDTRELGQAMERTASIAHSANMDFGNTTAFLAQMIETTREAPENLGTAMKTIIARFQELKANPYEISEVDGEEVDFNRVDKALKSIGVDLMDNRDKFRDLDDVFMDIASKWDGLSQTQQRYIATTAAGSRQQSRFLAMVQNYDRLKELTEAAANSEGASQIQFNKTLDSFESKVNKLKNAWQQFTMSIANNQIIKGAVGGLTSVLDTVNNLINTLSGGNGIVKSFLSLFTAFAGLKIGGRVVNSLVGALGGLVDPQTSVFAGLRGGFTGNRQAGNAAFASQINQPIVNAINHLTAIMSKTDAAKQGIQNSRQRSDLINQRRNNIYDMMQTSRGGFSVKDVKKQIKGLSGAEQHAIYNNSPVLQKALQRSYTDAYKKLNLTPEAMSMLEQHQKTINQKMRSGQISIQEGLRHLYNPYQVGQELGGQTAEEIQKGLLKHFQQSSKENFTISSKISKAADKKGLTGQARADWINKAKLKVASQAFGDSTTANITKTQSAVLGLSKSANGAGQSIMGLGMALQAAGFQTAGAMFMNIGNGIMGIGMAAEGAASGVSKLGAAVKAIGLGSVVGIGAGVVALGALTAGVVAYMNHQKKMVKETQKAAREVTNSYEDIKTETQSNISKLTDYKDTFTELSKGVDSEGNNVDLGTEEYADYLKIANEVAKMHPELVKGYNASGNAILKSNKAVEEAIELEEKRQKVATDEYITEDSLQKLIEGRNSTKRWKVGQEISQGGHWEKIKDGEDTTGMRTSMGSKWVVEQTSTLKKHAQEVVDTIQKIDPSGELLKSFESQYGLMDGALLNLDERGIRAIQEHGASMLDQTKTQYKDAGEDVQTLVDDLNDNIAQVGKDTEGIEAVTEPIYKNLSTYASQNRIFEKIPEEFRLAAEQGLKDISKLQYDDSGAEITGKAMQQKVQDMANSVADLNGHGQEYQKIIESMDKQQEKFGNHLDLAKYGEGIKESITTLTKWKNDALEIYKKTGDESQKIIAESLANQIAAYDKFGTVAGESLSEGFNQLGDRIESAGKVYENFQASTEGINDFYTGADNVKQVIDDIKDGIDDAGKGSQTFWKGAEAVLGEDFVKEGSFNKVNKQLKTVKDWFYDAEGEARDAQETVGMFFDYVGEHQEDDLLGDFGKKNKTVGDIMKVADGEFDLSNAANLTAEQFDNLAASLGMSDTTLASMLNKAKQFYNIDFSNADVLRANLATSEGSLTGKNINEKDQQRLYTRRSTFEAEAEAEGYTPPEYKKLEEKMAKNNVKLLSDAEDMKFDELKKASVGLGVKNGQDFIKKFSDLGYSKEDIQQLYDLGKAKGDDRFKDNRLDLKGQTFDEAYSKYIDSLPEEDKSAEESIASSNMTLVSNTSSILAAVGGILAKDVDKNEKVKKNPWNDGQTYYKGEGYKALRDVYGGAGMDTKAQYFANGLDIETGKELSTEKYKQYYNELGNLHQAALQKQAELEIAANNASSSQEQERLARQAEYWGKAAEGYKNYMKMGEEAHQKYLSDNKEEEASDNNKTKNKQKNNNDEALSAEEKAQREKDARSKAWTEKPQEKATDTSTTSKVDTTDIQSKFNSIATRGFSSLISGLTPESIKTPEAQSALNSIYKTALGSTIDNPATLTKDLASDFKTLGINVQDAIDAGLVVDKNNILGKAKKTGKDASDAAAQGTESGLDSSDTGEVKAKGKSKGKKIADDAAKGTSDGVSEGGKTKPQKQQPKETQQVEEPSVPKESTYTIKAEYGEVKKAQKAVNKLKESADGKTSFKINVSGTGKLKTAAKAVNKLSKAQKDTSVSLSAKVTGVNKAEEFNKTIKKANKLTDKTVKLTANTSGLSDANSLISAVRTFNNLSDHTVTLTTKKVTKNVNENEARGGFITSNGTAYREKGGSIFKRKGTDVVPAMLTPGEYVQRRSAVRYFGVDFMREINHKNLLGALQSFGSTAKGSRRGRVGPNNNGGLTLTGEEGFEVAWLPSENKSMILGADGPQMVDLPKDAVVYSHDQSEQILKRKSISASSASDGFTGSDKYRKPSGGNSSSGGGNSSGGSNGSRSGGSGGDGGRQAKKNQKKQTKILQKAGKINAWWWNMTKRVEATQRKIDQLNKKIEKAIDKVGTTLSSISGEATEYIKKLKQQIDLNTEMLNKADKKLGILSGEKTSKRTKDAKKAVKEDKKRLKKARKTDSKQDDKKAKKRLKKDQKELKKSQKGVNWARISYDVVKKKGKKKTKKSKKKRINLSPYIYLDPDTGAYNVDYDKINKEIGLDHRNKKGKKVQGNKSKAKATMEAAEKRIEKYQDRRNTAEDNIDKAQDALDELGQKLYETFFAWENELTKIWNVTQKIADAESKRGRAESFSELLDAQVADGTISSKNNLLGKDYFNKINTAFTKGINEQISSINLTRESIDLKKTNLQDLLNGETEKKTLQNIKDIIDYSSAYSEWDDLAASTQKTIKQTDKKIKKAEEDKKDAKKAIKKDNKIINSKKSTKKEKKTARQDKKEAKQDKKEATATINAYTELRDSLSDTLATANQEMQNILDAGYEELDAGKLAAYEAEKSALEDQLKIVEAANKYMHPETKDDGTISINFDTDLFEQDKQKGLLNSTTAEKIQEYVKKIVDETQDLHDTYKDLTEKITELHSTLADLQDAWVGYSEDLMSYLEDAQEVDIEKYKSLSDSIRDALEKLLDQVKKNLEERRRQEDNAKTERDISQKQQRLAALRADTSGGHQVEIAQLEKEIADAQTDYGRNLEDQLLDRLNDQADAAAEQRERIIELEEAINSAVNNAETVNKWMENPGQFKEEIRAAVYKAKDYQNLTKAQQEQVDRQTDQLLVGLETNPKKTEEVKNAINQMTALVEFLEGSLSDVGDNVEANKNNTDSIDDKVATVIEGLRGNIDAVTKAVKGVDQTLKDNETAEVGRQTRAEEAAKATNDASNQSTYKLAIANAQSNGTITANQFNKAISAGANINKSADQVVQDLKTSQLTWKEILTAAHNAGWGPKKIKDLNRNASKDSAFRKAWESIFPNKKWNEYATGGLASYTGPAWLDGTPSKPELVLNSADTKNFIALRDVLSKAMGNIDNSSETLTNTSYEININVDHINNDYDVDKIAARIKKDIVKDAGYRNVTQVRNLR